MCTTLCLFLTSPSPLLPLVVVIPLCFMIPSYSSAFPTGQATFVCAFNSGIYLLLLPHFCLLISFHTSFSSCSFPDYTDTARVIGTKGTIVVPDFFRAQEATVTLFPTEEGGEAKIEKLSFPFPSNGKTFNFSNSHVGLFYQVFFPLIECTSLR